jgi:antirestriction protein ArdC
MKLIITLLTTLCLTLGSLDAAPNFFRVYELLGVSYSVKHDLEDLPDIGRIAAVYSSGPDTIQLRKRGTFQSRVDYLGTILHELAHWAGARMRRAPRPQIDPYLEECIAEIVAQRLSEALYEGKYKHTRKDVASYLLSHPLSRPLSDTEIAFVKVAVSYTYDFLSKTLKNLDTKNELGL